MRKILVILLALILISSLTACNANEEANAPQAGDPAGDMPPSDPEGDSEEPDEIEEPEPTEESPLESPAAVATVQETVNGIEVDYSANDLVVIENYEGDNLDQLRKLTFDIGTGEDTYTLAIFGSVVDLQYMIGLQNSEGSFEDLEPHVKDAYITFRGVASTEGEAISGISFFDSNGERYRMGFTKDATPDDVLVVSDSGLYNQVVDEGHWLKSTYKGDGYQLLVEVDEVKEVRTNLNTNYLYIKYDGQDKKLLAQSRDMGADFTESIGGILNPIMNSDGTKLYYETDQSFTRTNGVGANNHRTRVIDLNTYEDRYFEEGAIETILEWGAYQDHVVLQTYTHSDSWEIVPLYSVYSPDGELLIRLDYLDDWEVEYQIEQEVSKLNPSKPEQEFIHEEKIPYNVFPAIVIEEYPDDGQYPFEKTLNFDNPLYPEGPYATYQFSVAGTITDVKLKTTPSMDSEPTTYDLADELTDTQVFVRSQFPSDSSVDIITFNGPSGREYSLVVEDMSGEMDVILVE